MIKIYGFPRSGNNLLAKYVADTFYPDKDTSVRNITWGHWSDRKKKDVSPHGKCLGNHTQFPENAIYIVRDPIDVAYSVWRSEGFTNKNYSGTFSDFLRNPLDWRYSPDIRYTGPKTIIEHHQDYLKESSLGYWVDYKSLVEFPEHVMTLISHWTDEPIKNFKRIDEPVGFSPNLGKERKISKEDADFVDAKVSERRARRIGRSG